MVMKYTQTKFQAFSLRIKRKKKVDEKSICSLHSIVTLNPVGPFSYDVCH